MSHRPLAIPFCASAFVLGSVLVPLGLFPGAFDRRAAGALVSPELPPDYYRRTHHAESNRTPVVTNLGQRTGVQPVFHCERPPLNPSRAPARMREVRGEDQSEPTTTSMRKHSEFGTMRFSSAAWIMKNRGGTICHRNAGKSFTAMSSTASLHLCGARCPGSMTE